jgi:hypothetical protein
MTTLAKIKRNYPTCNCRQVGSMQLFIVEGVVNEQYSKLLISYNTIIGKFINSTWYVTTQRYSLTTTQQISRFARMFNVIRIDDINSIT